MHPVLFLFLTLMQRNYAIRSCLIVGTSADCQAPTVRSCQLYKRRRARSVESVYYWSSPDQDYLY